MRLLTIGIALLLSGCVSQESPPGPDGPAPEGGFSTTAVFPGQYDGNGSASVPLTPGDATILAPELVTFPSDLDGVSITFALLRPDLPEPVPVLFHASPFYGQFNEARLDGLVERELFVPHGYAVVHLPTRGSADNGGCVDLFGPAERADVDQVVTWAATQSWSNGNVGVIGGSYGGGVAWGAAAMGNPHVKTIVPFAGPTDLYSMVYGNGSVQWWGPGLMNLIYYQSGFMDDDPEDGLDVDHTAEGAVCPEAFEGFGAAAYSSVFIERDPFGYWAERNNRPGLQERYRGSVFMVYGLGDTRVPSSQVYPWVDVLEAEGVAVKHLVGQWGHEGPDADWLDEDTRRIDLSEMLLHWYDHWLKEAPGVDIGPRAQVQDTEGAWRIEADWPPADAVAERFYLGDEGRLSTDEDGTSASVLVVSDPGDGSYLYVAEALGVPLSTPVVVPCAACPRFTTTPFDETFRFAGVPTVHLTVTPTGPAGHVSAFLYVENETSMHLVGEGQIDLRLAAGGETTTPVKSGEAVVARMVLTPMDVVVPPGARLTLVLSQGAPEERLPTTPSFPVHVEIGGDSSVLTVKAFERGTDVFFEVPRFER